MRFAIIGAGNVGSALARAIQGEGHDVVVTARSSGRVDVLVEELGVQKAGSNKEAVAGADVVVLAVPFAAVEDVLAEVGSDLDDKIVIDPTNHLKADYSGLAVEGTSGAEIIQGKAPGAKVVKAFNTIFASKMADPVHEGTPLDGLIAGDDAEAKTTVLKLLERMGCRPLDCGPVAAARYLEAMAFLNIALNARNGWAWQTGWKLIGPTT